MSELLPCPFCGGEAHVFKLHDWWVSHGCEVLGRYLDTRSFGTEAEAIAAWNTRYHSEFEKTVIKAWKEIKDYTERTCRNLSGDFAVFCCSECGYFERDCACANYCPNCGARVRSE